MSEETINDLQSFPVLTSEVSRTGGQRSGSANGSSLLGQTVEATLREVLAWRPRPTDPGGFLAALNQAFSVTEVEGHTEWAWKARSYSVQADLGQVTGAQASLYARARNALDQSIPLLEGLSALRPDADAQDVDAIRAIVTSEFTELVYELGQEGGPRTQRVDTLFESLLGPDPVQARTEDVRGLLGTLRERFGLDRGRVNTIDEEQTLTNFLIVVEHITSLKQSWDSQRQFFSGDGSDVFLGTQLVLLSRQLAVLSESVQEAYFVMDSVFLGPAERQTVLIPLGLNQPALTIAQLLEWIEGFANEEGPRIIRNAGKDGVISLGLTVNKLLALTTLAQQASAQRSAGPQRGFYTARTTNAFAELTAHLGRASQLINQIRRQPPPKITVVNPPEAVAGVQVRLTVDGSGFQQGVAVRLERAGQTSLPGQSVTFVSPSQLDATFDLPGTAEGVWSVIVTNPDGGATGVPDRGTLNIGGRQLPPSDFAISGIGRDTGEPGETFDVFIFGSGFQSRPSVSFGDDDDIKVNGPAEVLSTNRLRVNITIADDADPKLHDVTVTSNGHSGTLANGFTVSPPTSTLKVHTVSPSFGAAGASELRVAIYGAGFKPDAVSDFEAGITPSTTFKSSTELEVILKISTTAAGTKDVTVTSGGKSQTLTGGFIAIGQAPPLPPQTPPTPPSPTPSPSPSPSPSPDPSPAGKPLTISDIDPQTGRQGETVEVVITGTGFVSGVECDCGDDDDIVVTIHEITPESLKVDFAIDLDAATGPHQVTVTKPVTNEKVKPPAPGGIFTVEEDEDREDGGDENKVEFDVNFFEFLDRNGNRLTGTDDPDETLTVPFKGVALLRVILNETLNTGTVSTESVFVVEGPGNEDDEINGDTAGIRKDITVSVGADALVIECKGNFHAGDYTLRLSGEDTSATKAIKNKDGEELADGEGVTFKFNITDTP